MYYLQATVYEQHGDYDVHAYLWMREKDLPDLLLADSSAHYTPLFSDQPEVTEILTAIATVLTGIAQDPDEMLSGESLF